MHNDDEIMAQVLAVFQEEQTEHREAISNILLELERNPNHPQRAKLFDQLFREAHSLKGGARAAGITAVEQLAHWMEDLFSAVRQGTVQLTPTVCDPIYATLDVIRSLMQQVAEGESVQLAPYELLITLSQVARMRAGAAQDAVVHNNGHAVESDERASSGPETAQTATAESTTSVRLSTSVLDNLLNETGELTTCNLRSRQRARDAMQLLERTSKWRRSWRKVRTIHNKVREHVPTLAPTVHYLQERENVRERAAEARLTGMEREMTLLVDALGQANELIRDLEASLGQHARALADDSVRLGIVADRLNDQVRRTRMLPIAGLFNQMRLQAREVARQANKQAALLVDDGGAEADRQVLERLRDVLVHLIRNAIDHGLETEEERLVAGKPGEGQVALRASVSGDRLIVEVEDDGAGLNLAAVRERALSTGLVNETELARMSEPELIDLIFTPGFSTRQTVSKLSGRGVGLDIVRSQVERMHGRVHVSTTPGRGTIFTVSVPLSLTTSHGLMLRVGPAIYAIPLDSVQRIIAVASSTVHIVEGRPALTLEGRPVALVPVADLLGLPATLSLSGEETRMALILGSGERQVACVIDAVLGEQGLVVHRLPAPLQQVHCIAGATILADGRVVPVLDPVDLLRSAIGARSSITIAQETATEERKPTVLVVDDSITTRTLEKNILEAAGYRVRLATDGAEALHLLRQLHEQGGCDLLLSDVDMPRLNGFELTASVRSDPALRHLPIVLITSLDSPADRERGIAAGADAYIVKRSFDQRSLLETISQLL